MESKDRCPEEAGSERLFGLLNNVDLTHRGEAADVVVDLRSITKTSTFSEGLPRPVGCVDVIHSIVLSSLRGPKY